MKHYFQHPKGINGSLNTSTGKIDFETDEFGRNGIFTIPHTEETLPIIAGLQQLKLKDIGEPSDKIKKENVEANATKTGRITFQHPHQKNVTLHTSAGDITFVNGEATVDGKKADILIGLKYPQVTLTVTKLDLSNETPKPEDDKKPQEQITGSETPSDENQNEQIPGSENTSGLEQEYVNTPETNTLSLKQLKSLAKKNNVEIEGKNEAEITALLKEKGII